MFGEEAVSELSKIPLPDSTISRRIHGMTENIECNIKSKILKHKLLALQIDGSTDIAGKAQLLVFICFIDDKSIVEDFLVEKNFQKQLKDKIYLLL